MSRASTLQTPHAPLLSWHGFTLSLPDEWSPVKIEGDWHKGAIMLADLHATRLAMRWESVRKPATFDAGKWSKMAVAREVGQLMLEKSVPHVPSSEWTAGRLFVEPEPPGRDMWVGFHRASGRALELVHQSKRVSTALRDELVANLEIQDRDAPQRWSIFDLACTVPSGWTLKSQRLNAGDLTLTFGKGLDTLVIRQVRPAKLALARQPDESWMEAQQRVWKKFYRIGKTPAERLDIADGLTGLYRAVPRRRRFFYMRWLAGERHTLLLHDAARDALVFIDASTRAFAEEILATIGGRP